MHRIYRGWLVFDFFLHLSDLQQGTESTYILNGFTSIGGDYVGVLPFLSKHSQDAAAVGADVLAANTRKTHQQNAAMCGRMIT